MCSDKVQVSPHFGPEKTRLRNYHKEDEIQHLIGLTRRCVPIGGETHIWISTVAASQTVLSAPLDMPQTVTEKITRQCSRIVGEINVFHRMTLGIFPTLQFLSFEHNKPDQIQTDNHNLSDGGLWKKPSREEVYAFLNRVILSVSK
jgi:hypothetical protein